MIGPDDVARIVIAAQWLGLASPPSRADLLEIRAEQGRFIADDPFGRIVGEVDRERVAALVEAMGAPAVAALDPDRLGGDEEAIRHHFESAWTDDCAMARVKVILRDGRLLAAGSESQHAYMLPWSVCRPGEPGPESTFDPRISRAIARLLPGGFLERDRLRGWSLGFTPVGEDDEDVDRPEADGDDWGEEVDLKNDDDWDDDDWDNDDWDNDDEPPVEVERPPTAPGGFWQSTELLRHNTPLSTIEELLAGGANPDSLDGAGYTALMLAADTPMNAERFALLVQSGADVNARRPDGLTGLHLACSAGEKGAALAWIAAGADVDARATQGGATPLMFACSSFWWPAIASALLEAGAEVDARDHEGRTALMFAVDGGDGYRIAKQRAVVDLLLEAGADPNARDRSGRSVLDHFEHAARIERIGELVKAEMASPLEAVPPPSSAPIALASDPLRDRLRSAGAVGSADRPGGPS